MRVEGSGIDNEKIELWVYQEGQRREIRRKENQESDEKEMKASESNKEHEKKGKTQ